MKTRAEIHKELMDQLAAEAQLNFCGSDPMMSFGQRYKANVMAEQAAENVVILQEQLAKCQK